MISLIAMLFIVTIAFFATVEIWNGLRSSPTFTTLTNSTPQGKLAVKNVNTSLGIFADGIVMAFIVGAIASIFAAAFTTSSPIFAVLTFIILPIEILFAFIFHDAFFAIMQTSFFAGLVTTYPLVFTLFQYLPITAFILSLILIIMTFAK
jgi:hypothetical protein